MNDKKKPAHEIRLGSIKATIWANDTQNGQRYNAVLSRIYRLAEDKRTKEDKGWRESESFGRDDLLLLGKVADLAQTWMFEQTATDKKS